MKATVSLPVHPLIAVLQQQSLKSHRRKVKSKFTENPANLVVLKFDFGSSKLREVVGRELYLRPSSRPTLEWLVTVLKVVR